MVFRVMLHFFCTTTFLFFSNDVFECLIIGFCQVFTGFYWVLLGFTEFYRVLLGFTGFYWVSLGFSGFY